MIQNKRIYLDYASATPVRGEVLAAMMPHFDVDFGNASAIHAEGRRAHAAVEDARLRLARLLVVRPNGVTFTSGGTEANNLALFGAVAASGRTSAECEIIVTETEHPSILETAKALASRGVGVRYAPVQEDGRIDMVAFSALVSPQTVLVSCAYANSETGVVQDLRALVRVVQEYNRTHQANILVHTDASQAPLWLPLGMDALGVDMMTLDTGKCYGPKGLGVLARKHGVPLVHQVYGGSQEGGLRAGTENTALIVGGVEAIRIAQEGLERRVRHVVDLRDRLCSMLEAELGVVVNGSRQHRLVNNVNISCMGMDTEYAVVYLDTHGVAVSTRSACGTGDTSGSHVVRAMTHDDARAKSTLRITLGEATTEADIAVCVARLKEWHQLMASA